jgi:disulfide bond formation protein DsbB
MDFSVLFTKALATFTLGGNILFMLLLIAHVVVKPFFRKVMEWIGEHTLLLGLFLSASATIGSLMYSQVVGYPACILCWVQRIFMYPLMFLFGLAWWRKDRSIIPYALLLTLLGGMVALYQWAKDMLALYGDPSLSLGCPVVAGLPSCDRIYVLEFGYITIPMIALNAFILIAVVLYASMRTQKRD